MPSQRKRQRDLSQMVCACPCVCERLVVRGGAQVVSVGVGGWCGSLTRARKFLPKHSLQRTASGGSVPLAPARTHSVHTHSGKGWGVAWLGRQGALRGVSRVRDTAVRIAQEGYHVLWASARSK